MTYSLLCVLCGEFRHTLYADECFEILRIQYLNQKFSFKS